MAIILGESSAAQIQQWARDKQKNEQKMLHRLNKVFSNPLAYNQVRKVVVSALVQMKIEANDRPGPVTKAVNAEKKLAVWHKVPLSDPAFPLNRLGDLLAELTVRPNRFDINDLSELIRVIGAWVENGGGSGGVPKSLTEAFRPGDSSRGLGWEEAKALIWGKRYRQRSDRVVNPELYHAIEAHVRGFWIPPKRKNPSGLMMFRVKDEDLCRKIDLLFGLLKGATISGTTTDTALVLEAWGYEYGLHAGYYLFPVATIAASLHHTLLEAGLALSLIDAIDDYKVGFYTSLKPKGGFPGELNSVPDILVEAENDPDNRRLLIWYKQNSETPAGAVVWDKKVEETAYKRLAGGKDLLHHVRTMSNFPSKKEVARYISLMANDLYRALPVSFKSAAYS